MSGSSMPQQGPPLPWRLTSSLITGLTGAVSKAFLFGFCKTEVHGLQRFLDILESRRDPNRRQRGLITVSNHMSIVDDPLMWGVLPLRYAFKPTNLRWGLGAHDICFKNKLLSDFFSYGQVLPTHRLNHSTLGGLFQPTMTQAIRLLSARPIQTINSSSQIPLHQHGTLPQGSPTDPFSSGLLTYSTDGTDLVPAPSAYHRNRHAWLHVFPEGAVHQHATADMRYFKWGIARLVLEAEPAPDVVPMFIDGIKDVMPEDRGFPRFLPRVGARVRVAFGERLVGDEVFGDLRGRWRELVARRRSADSAIPPEMGELRDEELRDGSEAREIRVELARRVREKVLEVRRSLEYPEPEPSFALAETWAKDPDKKKYKSEVDGSLINQD